MGIGFADDCCLLIHGKNVNNAIQNYIPGESELFLLFQLIMNILSINKQKIDILEKNSQSSSELVSCSQPGMAPIAKAFRKKQ